MVHLRSVYLGVAAFLLGSSLAAPALRPLPHNPASGGIQVPSTENQASGDIVNLAARSPLFGKKKDYVIPPSPSQLLNAKAHDEAAADHLRAFKSSTAVADANRRAAAHFQDNPNAHSRYTANAGQWDRTAASHRSDALHHHTTAQSSRAGINNIHSPEIAKMSSNGAIAHHKMAQKEHALLNTVFPPTKSKNHAQNGQHRPAAASQPKNVLSKAGNVFRNAWRAVTPGKHK